VLLLSNDTSLAERWRQLLPYGVEQVPDAAAAVQILEQQGNVIVLTIDSALCDRAPQDWLVGLRTALVSSGLPTLFVLREETEGSQELQVLLDRFGAMHIGHAEAQTDAIAAALNLLLQGVH
jgi:hypothetical protein